MIPPPAPSGSDSVGFRDKAIVERDCRERHGAHAHFVNQTTDCQSIPCSFDDKSRYGPTFRRRVGSLRKRRRNLRRGPSVDE